MRVAFFKLPFFFLIWGKVHYHVCMCMYSYVCTGSRMNMHVWGVFDIRYFLCPAHFLAQSSSLQLGLTSWAKLTGQ